MSGVEYQDDCEKCGGKGTRVVYEEWKPYILHDSDCMACGWRVRNIQGQISEEELEEERERSGYDPETTIFR